MTEYVKCDECQAFTKKQHALFFKHNEIVTYSYCSRECALKQHKIRGGK